MNATTIIEFVDIRSHTCIVARGCAKCERRPSSGGIVTRFCNATWTMYRTVAAGGLLPQSWPRGES
jgi:hypothetical protein